MNAIQNSSGLSKGGLALFICWPLVCAAAVGFYVYSQLGDLRGEILARPPVAVMGVNEQVLRAIETTPGISANDATVQTYKVGEQLAARGYLVLDKNSIVAFPADYEVAP